MSHTHKDRAQLFARSVLSVRIQGHERNASEGKHHTVVKPEMVALQNPQVLFQDSDEETARVKKAKQISKINSVFQISSFEHLSSSSLFQFKYYNHVPVMLLKPHQDAQVFRLTLP